MTSVTSCPSAVWYGRAFALLPLHLCLHPSRRFVRGHRRPRATADRNRLPEQPPRAAEGTTADGGGSACVRGAGQSAEAQLRRGGGREARGRCVHARSVCGGAFSSPFSAGSAIPPPPVPYRPASTCGAAAPPGWGPPLRGRGRPGRAGQGSSARPAAGTAVPAWDGALFRRVGAGGEERGRPGPPALSQSLLSGPGSGGRCRAGRGARCLWGSDPPPGGVSRS